MRTPIAYALGYPERIQSGSERLDFLRLSALTFEAPDLTRFPCLRLAYHALEAGPAASIVLNASNEMAVEAFLERRLAFTDIARVISQALDSVALSVPQSVEDVLAIDALARAHARRTIGQSAPAIMRSDR
jgi:1-deoxy-D-xylulose-5-phosphate reductoisomerase